MQDFRLSRDAAGSTNVAHLQYEYDDAGNVLSIADAVDSAPGVPERQCFVYDHLRRLTEAWSQAGVDPCAENPSTAEMGGPVLPGDPHLSELATLTRIAADLARSLGAESLTVLN